MLRLCHVDDVPDQGCKRISRGRKAALAVFNLDGSYYVLSDRCSHGAARLSMGTIRDGKIVCPAHFGSFDIRTGVPVDPPCDTAVACYPVTIRDGAVFAEIEDAD